MSIIFFRFFLLFSVVANSVGSKTRYHRACSWNLTSLVLSRSLRFAAKILYEIMLDRIFCNFSFFIHAIFLAYGLGLGAVLEISTVSATFFSDFFRLLGWVWELFWGFLRFQLLFSGFFSAFGVGLGAVLGISAVSATFFWIFFGFWVGFGSCFGDFCGFSYFFLDFFGFWVDFGSCFKSFMDYSSTRACLLCYQPMAIVHYANLVLLNKYTFLTEGRYARPGHWVSHMYSPAGA